MTKPCATYEQARELLHRGELQAWDGLRWSDIPPGMSVFFSREVHDYRRKPEPVERVPEYYTVYEAAKAGGRRVTCFDSARAVASYLWGKDIRTTSVFKRVQLHSLDLKEIEEQLEST